jgi:hypothetical protein
MIAVIVMVGCLTVMVCRCLVLCGRGVLLFLGHGEVLLKTKSMTFRGKVPG